MKARKSTALGLAGALAISGAATLVASTSANAYSASSNLNCRLYFSDTGTGSSPSTMTDNYTLTQSPANAPVGSTVTVKFSGAKGPKNGPVAVDAGTNRVQATIALSGAQSGSVNATLASYPPADVPANPNSADPNIRLGGYTVTGTYKVTKAGSTTAALKLLKFDNTTAFNVDTYCTDAGADLDVKASGGKVSTKIKQANVNGVAPDKTAPVVKVTKPKGKAAKVKAIKGSISDNVAAKSVTIQVSQKIGKKWYSFNGKKLVKKGNQKKALAGAKKLTANTTGKFSIKVKKLKKGTIYVTYSGTDKAGNKSKAKTLSAKLK